jgi:hypothetical protein
MDWNRTLRAWWALNGNTNDTSTYGSNATAYNTVYNSTGKIGGAYQFNGASSYMDAGPNSSLKPTASFTYAVWVKLAASQSSRTIMGCHNDATGGSSIGIDDAYANYVKFHTNTYSSDLVRSTSALTLNEWHYLVGTFNGTNVSLYIDGKLNNTAKASAPIYPAISFQIGRWVGGSSQYFNGTVDEPKVYSRALSYSEILSAYNASANQYYKNFTGLVNGTYSLTAYATDSEGTTNSTGISFTVNTTNAAPIIGIPSINSSSPLTDDTIMCYNGSVDDWDEVTWEYRWHKDSDELVETSDTLDLSVQGNGDGNENVTCSARAYDGNLYSEWKNSTPVTVHDSSSWESNETIVTAPEMDWLAAAALAALAFAVAGKKAKINSQNV